MADPNEITIRIASPMRFIDDDSDTAEEMQQSLSVIRKRNHSPDKQSGYASDSSPMPSLSPKTAETRDNCSSMGTLKNKRQPLELTIRGDNTIISIKTVGAQEKDSKKTQNEEKDVYEFINEQVKQIFTAPEREEIEQALETVGGRETIKQKIFKKKGLWETLSKAARETEKVRKKQKELDERYPSMVLLQDPPDDKPPEDQYPKMIMFGEAREKDGNVEGEKRKLEFRSKSMLNLPSDHGGLNDLYLERKSLDMKKIYLEQEKANLEVERKRLEEDKLYIQHEQKALDRGQSFLKQDWQVMSEKKQVLEDEKVAKSQKKEREKHFLKKEKLCLAMEKQLIEDEKRMMSDVEGLLKKEKAMLEKDRSILGGEKNILEEEKELLGKEKKALEKQRSFVQEHIHQAMDVSEQGVDDVDTEIEEVFRESLMLTENCDHSSRAHHKGCGQTLMPFSPKPCRLGNIPYPVYIPVYNLSRQIEQRCAACPQEGAIKRSKSIQTQTEPKRMDAKKNRRVAGPCPVTSRNCHQTSEDDLAGMPLGLLSGLFPRVVITSMNIPESNCEVGVGGDKKNAQITELPTDSPCNNQGPTHIQKSIKRGGLASLQSPVPDLTLKAASSNMEMIQTDSLDETETEESGFHTFTSEFCTKEDFCPLSDETMSLDNIHIGFADDFYSNETTIPKSTDFHDEDTTARMTSRSENLPLTTAGQFMYEKLTQLNLEQQPQSREIYLKEVEENEKENIQLTLKIREVNVDLNLSGQVSINLTSSTNSTGAEQVTISTDVRETQKPAILRSRLWHHSGEGFENKRRTEGKAFSKEAVSAGPSLTISVRGEEKTKNLAHSPCRCTCNTAPSYCKVTREDDEPPQQIPHNSVTSTELSPRTATLLRALKDKLENTQPETAVQEKGTKWGGSRSDRTFTGLCLFRQLNCLSRPPKVIKGNIPTRPTQNPTVPREYFCEDCLATMRLYEDDFISLQNMVDKFEAMSRLGA